MQAIGLRPKVHVSADGSGVVGHAGARLLADLADATGLTAAYSAALRSLRPRGTGHDPGRVATDLAVMLADGGEAIADLAVLRDQAGVFGPVASTPTAWRLLADTDEAALASLRAARGSAREVAWIQAAEIGEGIPAARAGGRELPGLILDFDATLVTCHSEKEAAAPTHKGGFGFHPLLCFLANTGEAVFGRLRPSNSGANTAADHIAVLDQALAQIPDAHRLGTEILIRADSAGSAKAFLGHVRDLRKRGIRTFLAWSIWTAIRPAPASLCAGSGRTPEPSCPCSIRTRACGIRCSSPTPRTPQADPPSSWRPVTARTHASRTTSGAARPPASAASPPATSPSTPSGSNSASRRSICWSGRASCCWTGNWLLPSRRSSATGCHTSPLASPAAADACACGYRRPGPGETSWPRPSIASPHCPVPPADRQTPNPPRPERPWRTRPPRRVSTMSEHRNRFGHPTVAPQRRLIAPTETARLARVTVLLPAPAGQIFPARKQLTGVQVNI